MDPPSTQIPVGEVPLPLWRELKNPFLSSVCANLRRQRTSIAPGARDVTVWREEVNGRAFVRVWFRTGGCTSDHKGLCTMCNYGAGNAVPEDVVEQVRSALAACVIEDDAALLISPSGSMFDTREVPESTRHALLDLASRTPAAAVVCETRPETITKANMRDFAKRTRGKTPVIEMGLESSNPWVLRWCVNKQLSVTNFTNALAVCREAGVSTLANVALGSAFLSQAAAVNDAVATIRWALDSGVDGCVVFPMQVREWTLLGWLWRHGLYEPPSLWGLIEVIRSIRNVAAGRLSIAWYRDYYQGSRAEQTFMPVLASPSTCRLCYDKVVSALDSYRRSGEVAALDAIVFDPCVCRQRWVDLAGSATIDVSQVAACYEAIGTRLMPGQWWARHGAGLVSELSSTFGTTML